MPATTFLGRPGDSFGELPPLAQWTLLDSAFAELAAPGPAQFMPMALIIAAAVITGSTWCLAWLLVALSGIVLGRQMATRYENRNADTSARTWAQRYRITVCFKAAGIAAGGLGAGWHGDPMITLLIAAPIAFAVTEACAAAWLAPAVHAQTFVLSTPLNLACFVHAALPPGDLGQAMLGGLFSLWAMGAIALADISVARAQRLARAQTETSLTLAAPGSHLALPPAAADFQRLLGRDQVTGLPNVHSFSNLLAQENDRASRAESPLSLLLIAWDEYETCAARLTPFQVDTRLADIAKRLRSRLRRQSDLLAYLGNGRFGVLLPATDAFGATIVSRNLQEGLALQTRDEAGNNALSGAALAPFVSVSIGAATYRGKGILPSGELLEFAEHALRDARNNGGNQVRRYDPAVNALRPKPYSGAKPKEITPYSTPSPAIPAESGNPASQTAAISKNALGLALRH